MQGCTDCDDPVLTHHCDSCGCVLCVDCSTVHRKRPATRAHELVLYQNHIKEERAILASSFASELAMLESETMEGIKQAQEALAAIEGQHAACTITIQAAFQRLRAALDAREAHALEALAAAGKEHTRTVTVHASQLQEYLHAVTTASTHVKAMLEGSPDGFVMLNRPVRLWMKELRYQQPARVDLSAISSSTQLGALCIAQAGQTSRRGSCGSSFDHNDVQWCEKGDNGVISEDGLTATKTEGKGWDFLVTAGEAVGEGRHAWRVEITTSGRRSLMIGVFSPGLDHDTSHFKTNDAWCIHAYNGALYGNGKSGSDRTGGMVQGDVVDVLVDFGVGTVEFLRNGQPLIGFDSLRGSVQLGVEMREAGQSVRLLPSFEL